MAGWVRRLLVGATDVGMLALSAVLALFLRENLNFELQKFLDLTPYLACVLIAAIAFNVLLGVNRLPWRYASMTDYARLGVMAGLVCLSATLAMFTYNRMEGVARSIPILHFLIATIVLIGCRLLARHWVQRFPRPHDSARSASSREHDAYQGILIVGVNSLTHLFLRALTEFSAARRVRIGGIVAHDDAWAGRRLRGHEIIAADRPLASILEQLAVHGVEITRILVTVPRASLSAGIQKELETITDSSPIEVDYLPRVLGLSTEIATGGVPIDRNGRRSPSSANLHNGVSHSALPTEPILRRGYWVLKYRLDRVAALVSLIVLAPLFLLVAGLVAVTIGVPVIFWQERPGVGGQPFRLYKFRTMGSLFDRIGNRVEDDARQTLVGRFLRYTRLDELPQLYNILRGEMTFIGPRPLLPADQPMVGSARLSVRPGLTGWAQVMGGRGVSTQDKLALDLWYIKNATLRLDLEIAARTVVMVIFGERLSRKAIVSAHADLKTQGIAPPANDTAAEGGFRLSGADIAGKEATPLSHPL